MSKINWEQHRTALELLDELDDVESGLSNTELEFMQSLHDWDGIFTEKQFEYLQNIHERQF